MESLRISRRRLNSILAEIKTLKGGDFPYPQSLRALELIEINLLRQRDILDKLDDQSSSELIKEAGTNSLRYIHDSLEILGFILRSTNVRNAFEMYGPLLRLSKAVIGQDVSLILSSEWMYSPFTYVGMTDLPNFVLIGLPASESANPLLLPVAGHELGHSLWEAWNLTSIYTPQIEDALIKEIKTKQWSLFTKLYPNTKLKDVKKTVRGQEIWEPASIWALSQVEESFCDFVGIRLFGEAYLRAFAYLLAPTLSTNRNPIYPPWERRVTNLVKAAQDYGIVIPDNYLAVFDLVQEAPSASRYSAFVLDIADVAASQFIDSLIEKAKHLNPEVIYKKDAIRLEAILKSFKNTVPAQEVGSLANLINAGWIAVDDPSLWKHLKESERENLLNEILLKSIEVFEIEQLLGKNK